MPATRFSLASGSAASQFRCPWIPAATLHIGWCTRAAQAVGRWLVARCSPTCVVSRSLSRSWSRRRPSARETGCRAPSAAPQHSLGVARGALQRRGRCDASLEALSLADPNALSCQERRTEAPGSRRAGTSFSCALAWVGAASFRAYSDAIERAAHLQDIRASSMGRQRSCIERGSRRPTDGTVAGLGHRLRQVQPRGRRGSELRSDSTVRSAAFHVSGSVWGHSASASSSRLTLRRCSAARYAKTS
jgi:hypothetical protein